MKYTLVTQQRLCPFCEKAIPTVEMQVRLLHNKFAYEALDMSQAQRIGNNLYHNACVATPEFKGWLPCYLKKKGK